MATSTLPVSSRRPDTPLVSPPLPPPNPILDAALEQWLFTDEEITQTPSIIDGMPMETEHTQRAKGVNFIVQVGVMLKLPQLTLATASVFLHRFFMRYSMVDQLNRPGMHPYPVAATSLFLATKVEENCRKMRELVVACCRVAQKNPNLVVDEQSKEFWKWRDTILHNEDTLLEALCFDLQLEQPYRLLYGMICFFGVNEIKPLRNAAWAFINDSMYTILALQFPPRVIAAAALYVAAKLSDVSFNDDGEGRSWWEQVSVDISEMRRACNRMAQLYEKQSVHRQSQPYTPVSVEGDIIASATDKTRNSTGTGPNLQAHVETPTRSEMGEVDRSRRKRSRDIESGSLQTDSQETSQAVTSQRSPPLTSRSGSADINTEREYRSQNEPLPKRQRTNDNTPDPANHHPKLPNISAGISQSQSNSSFKGVRRVPQVASEHNTGSNTNISGNSNQPLPYSHKRSPRQGNNHQLHENRNGTEDINPINQQADENDRGIMGRKDGGDRSLGHRKDTHHLTSLPPRENNYSRDRDRDQERDRYWEKSRGHGRDSYDHRDRDRNHEWNPERDPENRPDRNDEEHSRYRSPNATFHRRSPYQQQHRLPDRIDSNDRTSQSHTQEDEGGGGSEEGEL